MEITGNVGQEIPIDIASEWTANYRKLNPNGILAHAVGQRVILRILGQPDCVGLRTYYAIDENGKQQLIFVGVDKDGNDLYKGIVADRSLPCPNFCSTKNPLNSNG